MEELQITQLKFLILSALDNTNQVKNNMRIVIALEYMILGGVIEEFDLTNKTLQAMLRSQYSASVPHANIRTSS